MSLRQHRDPAWIASQSGFEVGKLVVQKQIEVGPERIFRITSIAEIAQVEQVCSYIDEPKKVELSLSELLTNWSIAKVDPPFAMTGGQQRSSLLDLDELKIKVWKAIKDSDSMSAAAKGLKFWRRPDEVRTTQRISAGALSLSPIAPFASVCTKSNAHAVSIGKHDAGGERVEIFVLAPPKPRSRPLRRLLQPFQNTAQLVLSGGSGRRR